VSDFFVDVPYQGEIVRARGSSAAVPDGSNQIQSLEAGATSPVGAPGLFILHEGGTSYVTLPATPITREQVSPTRDTRLVWMQSVMHCTHYIAGAGEKAYLRQEEAPEIAFVNRDPIDRSDEAYTEIEN
jgi:hypothetical protein